MSSEFRYDAGASYASMSALIYALPSNQVWNGSDWVAVSALTTAEAYTASGAAIQEGVQETIQGDGWDGTYLFSLPAAPPSGTAKCRAVIYSGATPVLQQQVGTADYEILTQAQLANGVLHGGATATIGFASLGLVGSSSAPIVNIQNNGIGAGLRINASDGSNYAMILTGGSAGTVGLFNEGGPVFDFQGAGDLLNLACGGSNAIPVTDPNGSDPPGTEAIADADLPTAPEIDTELSTTHGSGAWGGGSGGGATPAQIWTYTPRTLTGPNNVTVVISNPVAQNKNLQITQGDAYDTLTNQPIVFYDNGTWPVMTNGSTQLATVEIKLSIAQSSLLTNIVLSIMGSVTGASPNQVATFTPTATQTQALTPGADYSNDVRASMNYPTNTEIRELVTGSTQVNVPITTAF